jgi:hypothetical protein
MKGQAGRNRAGSERTLRMTGAVVVSLKRAESTIGDNDGPEAVIVGIGPGKGLNADGLSPISASAQGATV